MTDNLSSSSGSYEAESIKVLKGLEGVRKRPAMYIGDTGKKGLHHLVFEVLDNSVDEAIAQYADYVKVEFFEDGSVQIPPHEVHQKSYRIYYQICPLRVNAPL
jgi:DNA gyrase subunit B